MLIGMVALGWDVVSATPSGRGLVIGILLLAIAAIGLWFAERHVAPTRPQPADHPGELRRESPAVVNMLTNDATLTASGFRATLIDLAARGWLRLLPPADDDDDLGRVRPAATAERFPCDFWQLTSRVHGGVGSVPSLSTTPSRPDSCVDVGRRSCWLPLPCSSFSLG